MSIASLEHCCGFQIVLIFVCAYREYSALSFTFDQKRTRLSVVIIPVIVKSERVTQEWQD